MTLNKNFATFILFAHRDKSIVFDWLNYVHKEMYLLRNNRCVGIF